MKSYWNVGSVCSSPSSHTTCGWTGLPVLRLPGEGRGSEPTSSASNTLKRSTPGFSFRFVKKKVLIMNFLSEQDSSTSAKKTKNPWNGSSVTYANVYSGKKWNFEGFMHVFIPFFWYTWGPWVCWVWSRFPPSIFSIKGLRDIVKPGH